MTPNPYEWFASLEGMSMHSCTNALTRGPSFPKHLQVLIARGPQLC